MDKKLKQYFVKSFVVLLLIHLGYFLYGFFMFEGIANTNSYFEFYRFKFYDDVSISHFFITGLFLLFFLVFLLRNHYDHNYSHLKAIKISFILLLISFLSLSFFVSYSFGLNAKLRSELPESDFNKDKTLLNVLNPFLYNYTSYSSEKLFNPVNILYPKPYPIIEVADSTFNGQYYEVNREYYSIDTLRVLTTDLYKISNSILYKIGFDQKEITERIIRKNIIKDSTELIYKGMQVHPDYDDDICIFLENKELFTAIDGIPIAKQQYSNAVKRYKLLYQFKKDSLQTNFQRLDTLFKKYKIQTYLNPKDLTKDVVLYKNTDKSLNEIRNNFDREALTEKFAMLNRLFYEPNYLHQSIIEIFFGVIIIVWLLLFLIYVLFNYRKKTRASQN